MEALEEPNSFKIEAYVHFCTRQELIEDFDFLKILKLDEWEFFEPRASGDTHHHRSWILIGTKKEK